jgi:hypothetical protein
MSSHELMQLSMLGFPFALLLLWSVWATIAAIRGYRRCRKEARVMFFSNNEYLSTYKEQPVILEKLLANTVLTEADRSIYEQGLISILREIHAELDRALDSRQLELLPPSLTWVPRYKSSSIDRVSSLSKTKANALTVIDGLTISFLTTLSVARTTPSPVDTCRLQALLLLL